MIFKQYPNSIALIGGSEKMKIIKDLMEYDEYREYIGVNNFTDYISVPERFASNDPEKLLNELGKEIESADYISPKFEGKGGHPILLSEKIINDLKIIEKDQMHFKEFLNNYLKHKVKVYNEKILVNINTEEEYEKYFL